MESKDACWPEELAPKIFPPFPNELLLLGKAVNAGEVMLLFAGGAGKMFSGFFSMSFFTARLENKEFRLGASFFYSACLLYGSFFASAGLISGFVS